MFCIVNVVSILKTDHRASPALYAAETESYFGKYGRLREKNSPLIEGDIGVITIELANVASVSSNDVPFKIIAGVDKVPFK
jgi:hypothetical protein